MCYWRWQTRRNFGGIRRMSEQDIKDAVERDMTWRISFKPEALAREIALAEGRLSRAEKDLSACRVVRR